MLNHIRSLSAYQELVEQIQRGDYSSPDSFGLGLPRTARLAIMAALYEDLGVPMLLLTNRADRALTLFDELGFWMENSNRLFFPEPNPLFYETLNWSPSTRRDRLTVLTQLAAYHLPFAAKPVDPPFITAAVRSIMTRTLPRRNFLRSTRALKVGQTVNPDELISAWAGLGYEYSNIVVQVGQFSRRGGILDIWSPSALLPVRVEFFGNQVDTLRSFNPATQRTVEPLQSCVIFPAREYLPVDAAEQGLEPDELNDNVVSKVYPLPASPLDYLPEETLIFLDGREFITAAVNDIEEDAVNRRRGLVETGSLPEDAPVPYMTWSELEDSFRERQIIELGHTNTPDMPALASHFSPGPRFAGRLKEFTAHLHTLEEAQQQWTVISRQSSRLNELWKETRLPSQSGDDSKKFIEGTLSSGWVLRLPDGSAHHLLSDSEVFGWGRPQPRRKFVGIAETPESAYGDLKPGDYVVHVDYGIGKFSGLIKPVMGDVEREFLCIEYKDNDQLFVPIHQADRLTRYIGPSGETPHITRLGGSEWSVTKQNVQHAVREVATDLLELYTRRKIASGFTFSPDSEWQKELEASFPYTETEDQSKAIQEIKADMESAKPMDRLLCGDVGYGKTEVTLRAAFKAVMDSKQVAVLVPTTVLAQQHYDTFRERLAAYPVKVEMLSRFRNPKEQTKIVSDLGKGNIDIIIGTHRLISNDVVFKDLGLVVIDEEQRFGVTHKEHLKQLRTSVDILTLTATPIPRTLYMALTGARDISTINTPPEERLPIVTHIGPYDTKVVREAIIRELERGGQIFFVHNRVKTIAAIAAHLKRLVPEASIGIGHGQMDENELADVMHQFTNGEIDILLCTSIIESGLDIPNANTLIVDRADTFGLAQLYQLRGRVGRGAQRAYAYLFRHKNRPPTIDGQERMEVLAENTQLGAGYSIAMRDLEMRGAGELLGMRQSGYIASVGFHLYTKLLTESVQQFRLALGETEPIKNGNVRDVPSMPINVELPLSMGIPPEYIPDQELRLNLYRRIADLRDEEEVTATAIEFSDRFGALPEQVENLLYQMRIKIKAARIGLASITIENGQMLLRYPPLPEKIKQRNLPHFDTLIRPGKNAYWIAMQHITDTPWQTFLSETLTRIEQLSSP